MKRLILILFITILISSCSPSPEVIQNAVAGTLTALAPAATIVNTQASIPTNTPEFTVTKQPSRTPIPTKTIAPTRTVGPTDTPAPSNTPTVTLPPEALTATAKYELDLILYADHKPGVYLVNIDIGPGIWRNNSTKDSCYWMRSDKYGEIIDNYFGFGGGTIYIDPTDFSVELDEDCGIWTYFGPP